MQQQNNYFYYLNEKWENDFKVVEWSSMTVHRNVPCPTNSVGNLNFLLKSKLLVEAITRWYLTALNISFQEIFTTRNFCFLCCYNIIRRWINFPKKHSCRSQSLNVRASEVLEFLGTFCAQPKLLHNTTNDFSIISQPKAVL